MIRLLPSKTDDLEFIGLLNRIVEGVLRQTKPKELYIIAIDNWFDHKWLRFSGIGVVDFEFPLFLGWNDGALTEFRQHNVTLPPFAPNRVISQRYFCKQDGVYVEKEPPVLLHKQKRQHSARNLHRRIGHISGAAAFVWYSSKTLENRRASIMTYSVMNAQIETWFVGFNKTTDWRLHLTKGINRDRVQRLLTDMDE